MSVNGVPQVGWNSSPGEWFQQTGVSGGRAKPDSAEFVVGSLPVFLAKGSVFFLEGESATGIFYLRTGRAKELLGSYSGRTAIVRVVGPGDILGLPSVLTSAPNESTIEALEPCRADFLGKAAFLQLLKTSGQLGQVVASQLSRDCQEAYASLRCLALSCSASGRLARLVLHWAECPLAHDAQNAKVRILVSLNHSEIAQSMGTTRETTSRTLREFREKRWITTKGSVWTIMNEDAIRHVAAL
jgi:CRP/FNR family transcriptional regulator, cyclic AMP receptor protein